MCDVLILEWTTILTRDRLVASQVFGYLSRCGVNVKEGPLQNGPYLIDKLQPKILLLVNTIGAVTSIEVAKYAKEKNVIVVSLFGEGNFSQDRIEQFVWGHNKYNKDIIDDFRMVWSNRALKLLVGAYPYLAETTFNSGSVGADNYVVKNIDNESFKRKYADFKNYNFVVGVGCWNFCLLDDRDHRFESFLKHVGKDEVVRLITDSELFNEELTKIVTSMPDVLFLIKEHPHKSDFGNSSGVNGLELFDNVLFVERDESIIDCISASNIWLSYESTTAMEAWLIGKPTALLNPTGTEFITPWRSNVHEGQPNYKSSTGWINAINSYRENGTLPSFGDFKQNREKILSNTFGYMDGLNHVRVSNFIIDVLSDRIKPVKSPKSVSSNYSQIQSFLKNIIWYFNENRALRCFLGFSVFKRFLVREWDESKLREYNDFTVFNQSVFYEKNNFSEVELKEIKVDYFTCELEGEGEG